MNRSERRRQARAARTSAGPADRLLAQATQRHQAGRLDEAVALYRRALDAAPGHPHARHYLGLALHQSGHTDEALPLLEAAAEALPRDPMVRYNLAEVLRETGRPDDAVPHYRAAAAAAPGEPDIQLGLGEALLHAGEAEAAETAFRAALRLAPDDGDALSQLGLALNAQRRTAEAVAALERALDAGADPAATRIHLGNVWARVGEWRRAEAEARAALDAAPDSPVAMELLARILVLSEHGDVDQAGRLAAAAVDADPGFAQARVTLGIHLQNTGDFDGAEAAYRAALEIDPGYADALYNLAGLSRAGRRPVEPATLEAELARPVHNDHERAVLEFALAGLYEADGRYDDAFTLYASANRRRAAADPFDPEAFATGIRRIADTFDAAFFARRQGWGVDDPRPVFIVGMPRSGTTLVEQVVASHPAVRGGGERDDVRQIIKEIPRRLGVETRFPDSVPELDADTARSLASEHLARLDTLAPGAERWTDKMPSNFVRLGVIALLFPGARVIHCRRDPRDTAVSCFVQAFTVSQQFSADLGWIGAYMRGYRQLMAHWRAVLPLPILDVDYEALVAEPEAQTRRLIDFVGLPWDERCLRPHESARAVRSASVVQVRQPIYASSVARWKRYEAHLGPFLEALGETPEAAS